MQLSRLDNFQLKPKFIVCQNLWFDELALQYAHVRPAFVRRSTIFFLSIFQNQLLTASIYMQLSSFNNVQLKPKILVCRHLWFDELALDMHTFVQHLLVGPPFFFFFLTIFQHFSHKLLLTASIYTQLSSFDNVQLEPEIFVCRASAQYAHVS